MASVKDMQSYGFSLDSIKTISEQDFDNLKNSDCLPKIGDVLIAKDGSYLKQVLALPDFVG
jgi:type I restriction enzyme S subunit